MTHQDYQLYIHYYLEIQFEDFYRKEKKKRGIFKVIYYL